MQENYELVQKGFRVLHPLLAGYIGFELKKAYRSEWWNEVIITLSDQRDLPSDGTYDELIDSLDIANCLRLIDRKWHEVFKTKLDLNCKTWAKELMGVRNTVAHIGQQDINQADAERALDTMMRICKCFNEKGAKELKDIYESLRNSTTSEGMTASGPSPIDLPVKKLKSVIGGIEGKSLLDLVGTEYVQKTTLTRKVTFAGKTQAYPVYKVRLDALYYNDQNDRIATWITRYRAENGSEALASLGGEEYNDVIENFIYESNPESIIKTQKNIALVGQREPGVALSDGRIVDGNRRYTCLRRIQRDSIDKLFFETVIMDVDIQTDKKQIKLLELAIQHGEEKKVDYDLIDYAIGTYMDVEKTKLITIDEYASSTNESVSDVKKRIEIAIVICEFLEYIKLPEQYHIAREYQIYSLLQEMMPSLKQLTVDERKQLKTIVFNNVIMKALIDQRKFIRDIKMLIKNDTHEMYFDDQEEINAQIHKFFDETKIESKMDLDKFARDNESITEELQLSLQKALLRSRRQQLKAKPSENVAKSVSLMTEFDARMLDKLDESEKVVLKREMDHLSAVVESYSSILSGDGATTDESGKLVRKTVASSASAHLIEPSETKKSSMYLPGKTDKKEPLIVCLDVNKVINTLSFSLSFKVYKEVSTQNGELEISAFFVDEMNDIVSNVCNTKLTEEKLKCNFVLNGKMSEGNEVTLVIKTKSDAEYEYRRMIPFDVKISFAGDFDL